MKLQILGILGVLGIVFITGCTSPTGQITRNNICSYNAYNCDDFNTQAQAQAMFETCGGVNNDVHWLDGDKDGIACEILP